MVYKAKDDNLMMRQIEAALSEGNPTHKMDILFYNSILSCRKSYVYRLALHIIKLILLCVFLPIDVTTLKSDRTIIIAFMAVGIAIVLFNLLTTIGIINVGYGNNQENNRFFVSMAERLNHIVPSEPTRSFDNLEDCVSSTMYNQSSGALINNEGLTDDIKRKYESIYSNLISGQVLESSWCLSFLEKNSKFASFGLVIFGIVALSIGNPSSQQIGVLASFIVLEALNVWITILILVLVALSPLIIFFLCIFCCCCSKNAGAANIPDSVEATPAIIEQTDGSCSVCFQPFVPKERVIILKCSNKHVFHEGCLTNWLRVSSTCPLCRKKVDEEANINEI